MTKNNRCKESSYSEMEKRINLQMISAYIRDGGDTVKLDRRSFEARETDAYNAFETFIKNLKLDEHTTDEILSEALSYMTTISDVYFSLGMKTGSNLIIKLTDNFESDL